MHSHRDASDKCEAYSIKGAVTELGIFHDDGDEDGGLKGLWEGSLRGGLDILWMRTLGIRGDEVWGSCFREVSMDRRLL